MSVELEWGEHGARSLGQRCDLVVIVDVLSFSTTVDVGVARGATILPFATADLARADEYAARHHAVVAARSREPTPEHPYTLSPVSLKNIPPGTRLVLPSPNGSTLTGLAAAGGCTVVAGCLRNASAIAAHASAHAHRIGVVPAGERWRDHSLRVAIEDLLGAGAIIAALGGDTTPEAELAAATFESTRLHLGNVLNRCVSGRELIDWGYPDDVTLAAELDVSQAIPWLQDGAYVNMT